MNISLRKITKENYENICELDVSKEQEDYVSCNMWSLVESFYNEGYVSRGIYNEEQPVGFLMWVVESSKKISIWRFMVDHKYQNIGIGRSSLELAIDEIQKDSAVEEIEILYNPKNPIAKEFYSSFGFVEIGMDKEGEDMIAVKSLCHGA